MNIRIFDDAGETDVLRLKLGVCGDAGSCELGGM
jgi:hypothetical protein